MPENLNQELLVGYFEGSVNLKDHVSATLTYPLIRVAEAMIVQVQRRDKMGGYISATGERQVSFQP